MHFAAVPRILPFFAALDKGHGMGLACFNRSNARWYLARERRAHTA